MISTESAALLTLDIERFEHADQVAENGGTFAEHG
jgi:hypothetical protein